MQVTTPFHPGRVCVAAALANLAILKASGVMLRNNAPGPLELLADVQARIEQATNKLTNVLQESSRAGVLSPENMTEAEQLRDEIKALMAQQDLLQSSMQTVENAHGVAGGGRQSQPAGAAANAGGAGGQRVPATPANAQRDIAQGGFNDFSELCRAVVNAAGRGGSGEHDNRLRRSNAAPASFGAGSVGVDGGFAIPPAFLDVIMQGVFNEEELAGRCMQLQTSGRSMTFPFDPHATYSTGGIQAHWRGEAETAQQSKPQLEEREIKLESVTGVVPVTQELLEDAPNIGNYVQNGLISSVSWRLTEAIMWGTGVKQPRGIMAGDPTVPADKAGRIIVPKETGQLADTVTYANILKIWGRMKARNRMNAVWVICQDVETQLLSMTGPDGKLIYAPPQLNGSPYNTLLGRPVLVHEVAADLGNEGDIALIDFSQYAVLTRNQTGNKFRVEASMYFLENIKQFALDLRVGGQPLWHVAQPNRSGTSFTSYAVTLQAR